MAIAGALAAAIASSASAQGESNCPSVFNAVPKNALGVVTVNLDQSQSNPVFQGIVSDLLSKGASKMPLSPQFLRYGLQMALQSANIPNASDISNNLDLTVAAVFFSPSDPANVPAPSPQKKKKTSKNKDQTLDQLMSFGALVVHDSALAKAASSLNQLATHQFEPKWWLGTKYYTLANGETNFSFMIDGDYLVIGQNPHLFPHFTGAIERGNSIVDIPAFSSYARSLSPSMVASLLIASPDTTHLAKAPFFSLAWRALSISAPANGLEISAFGPKLLTSARDAKGGDEVNGLFRLLPAGRMLSLALSLPGEFFGSDAKSLPVALGLYPADPNANGVPTGGDLVVVSKQNEAEKGGEKSNGIVQIIEALTGKIAKSEEGEKVKEVAKEGVNEAKDELDGLKSLLGKGVSKSKSIFEHLFKGKDLTLKNVNGRSILSTSDELLESAEKMANQVAPSTAPVTSRLVGMLSIEPMMVASLLDGTGKNGKPAMGLTADLELLMKSATGPVTLKATADQDFDTISLSLPLNWSVVKQVIDKGALGKSKS